MELQNLPIMMWWATSTDEFTQGLKRFVEKFGESPALVYLSHKTKWQIPEEPESKVVNMPENHFVFLINEEDFIARRPMNENVSSVPTKGETA